MLRANASSDKACLIAGIAQTDNKIDSFFHQTDAAIRKGNIELQVWVLDCHIHQHRHDTQATERNRQIDPQ